jgi:HAD superfamily hydrolase (TIGR01484 family)
MRPISDLTIEQAKNIRYVLMDIDDTLTERGKLPSASYDALWRLKDAGLVVVPITGRPAGWCDLIAREWPVDGVVGENGALVFWEESPPGERPEALPVLMHAFHPNALRNDHPALLRARDRALAEVAGCRVSKDQFSRLHDIAIDFAEEEPVLPLDDARRIKAIFESEGALAKISSIHVNAWMGVYDKLSMAVRFLADRFGYDDTRLEDGGDRERVVFVGDSPNDEPMFAHFPLACAVANIHRYAGLIKNEPAFVTRHECGKGFAELVSVLLEKRQLAE